ncbi:phosphoenolpyruvate carboxylase [Escherichia coli]
MGIIANGDLLDTLRRVKCFGVPLVRIDIRQESTRHTEALGELTRYLGIGDYESWSEADKQAFLIRELNSKRPLLPRNWQTKRRNARSARYLPGDRPSAARLHCRRHLDGAKRRPTYWLSTCC